MNMNKYTESKLSKKIKLFSKLPVIDCFYFRISTSDIKMNCVYSTGCTAICAVNAIINTQEANLFLGKYPDKFFYTKRFANLSQNNQNKTFMKKMGHCHLLSGSLLHTA